MTVKHSLWTDTMLTFLHKIVTSYTFIHMSKRALNETFTNLFLWLFAVLVKCVISIFQSLAIYEQNIK